TTMASKQSMPTYEQLALHALPQAAQRRPGEPDDRAAAAIGAIDEFVLIRGACLREVRQNLHLPRQLAAARLPAQRVLDGLGVELFVDDARDERRGGMRGEQQPVRLEVALDGERVRLAREQRGMEVARFGGKIHSGKLSLQV